MSRVAIPGWFGSVALAVGWICSTGSGTAEATQDFPESIEELPPPVERTVNFEADVRPILEGRCVECHGPEVRKSGLRLDNRDDALAGGDLGAAIEPGDSGESYLIHRVTGAFGESVMPPKGDPLSDEEVSILRAWIDQGAMWSAAPAEDEEAASPASDHWAFQPIERVEPPPVENAGWLRSPIDAFILRALEERGIEPAPEADREVLIRRLSLDLIGLPPTPEEVDAFVHDQRPNAYEALVDRLLASPHFGERWGRYWLDMARYADSDGYEKDRPRPDAYRYRDWVLDAFNSDLPFDQFTIEQLAGDLLPEATLEQLTAAGFHRNTLTNTEGGVDQEEFRVAAVIDRVNTTGTVWLGLTVACAQCHSHKYDPILQREYYQMFAFFNTTEEHDNKAPTPEEQAAYENAKAEHQREIEQLTARIQSFLKEEATSRLPDWEETIRSNAPAWEPLSIVEATAERGVSLTVQDDGAIVAQGDNPATTRYTIVGETNLPGITALRLEALPDDSLPKNGPGRAKNGNFVVSEFQIEAAPRYEGETPRRVGLASPSALHEQDGWPVKAALDGDPKTGWAIQPKNGERHVAVFETDLDLGTDCGTRFEITIDQQYGSQHTLGQFRIAVTNAPRPVEAHEIPDDARALLAIDPEQRTEAQNDRILDVYRQFDPDLKELDAKLAELKRSAPNPPDSKIRTFREPPPDERRETHMLIRGDFLRPGDKVEPGVIGVLHDFEAPEDEPAPDRLDLAHWLLAEENPLTARVAVNRTWFHLFGRAIVPTMDDFGTRGDEPSHPELLDWLATEYRRLGWSRKALIREIVLSAAYRQSSATRPELQEIDAQNALVARQNRVRLEAEVIRDSALFASGLLTRELGGPSVYPPQPPGISDLTYAGAANWPTSKGPDRYRRGLYTFFRRTSPYPMLTTFDAPEGNVCEVKREASNTPLQALTLLNDEVFVECARALGARVMNDADCDCIEDRVKTAFRFVLGRHPSPDETAVLIELYMEFMSAFMADADAVEALLGPVEPPEPIAPAEAAALVATSRALLNLDEFITRE